jgi:hypothetical protein
MSSRQAADAVSEVRPWRPAAAEICSFTRSGVSLSALVFIELAPEMHKRHKRPPSIPGVQLCLLHLDDHTT